MYSTNIVTPYNSYHQGYSNNMSSKSPNFKANVSTNLINKTSEQVMEGLPKTLFGRFKFKPVKEFVEKALNTISELTAKNKTLTNDLNETKNILAIVRAVEQEKAQKQIDVIKIEFQKAKDAQKAAEQRAAEAEKKAEDAQEIANRVIGIGPVDDSVVLTDEARTLFGKYKTEVVDARKNMFDFLMGKEDLSAAKGFLNINARLNMARKQDLFLQPEMYDLSRQTRIETGLDICDPVYATIELIKQSLYSSAKRENLYNKEAREKITDNAIAFVGQFADNRQELTSLSNIEKEVKYAINKAYENVQKIDERIYSAKSNRQNVELAWVDGNPIDSKIIIDGHKNSIYNFLQY